LVLIIAVSIWNLPLVLFYAGIGKQRIVVVVAQNVVGRVDQAESPFVASAPNSP
jgi:hypothetical protein